MTVQISSLSGWAVATVGLFVVWPLLVPSGSLGDSGRPGDLRVYRDQLGEVERDRDRGLLTEAQAEAARVWKSSAGCWPPQRSAGDGGRTGSAAGTQDPAGTGGVAGGAGAGRNAGDVWRAGNAGHAGFSL